MSLAAEILALLRSGSQGAQRVLPDIASGLERVGTQPTAPAIGEEALMRQLSRASQLREPPVGAELAGMHQSQLPLETTAPGYDELALDIHAPGDRGSEPFVHTSPMQPFPRYTADEVEDPRFALALEADQHTNQAFPEQVPGYEPSAIPEDNLQHTGALEGRPRVMDSEMARRQALAEQIPSASEFDSLPPRPLEAGPGVAAEAEAAANAVEPQLHPGVMQDPQFVLDAPIGRKLRDLVRLPRGEAATGGGLDRARRYADKAFKGSEETKAYTNDLLSRWEQRIRGKIEAGKGESQASATRNNAAHLEILKQFNQMMKEGNPHEALAYLDEALANTKGEISDWSAEAGATERILKTNARANRQMASRNLRSAGEARVQAGKVAPTLKGLEQYQTGAFDSESAGLYDNIVNPESIKGMRPGASEDPFENVRSGRQRSIVISEKELQSNTGVSGKPIAEGSVIILSNGEGKYIPATVLKVRKVAKTDAPEVGLRQGVTPVTMRQYLSGSAQHSGQQYEVVFKPVGAQKAGMEDSALADAAITAGQKSEKEAYMGIGVHSDTPNIPPENAKWLRDYGYQMDEPAFDRSKNTGSPYIAKGPNLREFWTQELVDRMREPGWANTPGRQAQLKHAEEALADPSKGRVVKGSNVRFNKNKPRDASQLGRGANIPQYPEGPVRPGEYMKGTEPATADTVGARPTDRRDNEFRPTSVGKQVTDPQTIVAQMRKGNAAGNFFLAENFAPGFAAKNSDATLSIGEDALQRANDPKSIAGAVAAINAKVKGTLKDRKQIILNLSGPDSHALKGKPVDVTAVAEILQGINSHPGRGFDIIGVLTDGQPGVQEAGAKAARQLGIATAVIMGPHMEVRHPKTGRGIWVPREIHEARFRGEDVSAHLDRLAAEGQRNIAAAKARK